MMPKNDRILVGIPVYNEAAFVTDVLQEVLQYADHVLVIDDGSTDETARLLSEQPVKIIRHATNRGYGRSTRDMFQWAQEDGFEWLITMDCDRQHEPAAIPSFRKRIDAGGVDVISGSRYIHRDVDADMPPADRRAINRMMTDEINRRLGLSLTDAFCGFKAYRVEACADLRLDVDGYDFPMMFWAQAVAAGLVIDELPVRLIYNDPSRSFGGPLDDQARRLRFYQSTLYEEIIRLAPHLPAGADEGLALGEAAFHG
ncbi:MAG: glycosyltransferase family 2 protein [Planctomycetota bacterium]|nr:glycosyltransferase family 2 protein [Planctomycetota bacterium]